MKVKSLLLLSLAFVFIRCGSNIIDVDELGKKVHDIHFGSGWDGNNLTGIATSFPNTTTIVYYEIIFENTFSAGGMIKKAWKKDGGDLLDATSFIPKNSHRICGEIHKYETQNMDVGSYTISLYWYSSLDAVYQEYPYDSLLNRTFKIE